MTDHVSIATLKVSRQGFGCMGLSHVYGQADEAQSLRTLDRAIELGINFLDTADVYGLGHNEQLVARALKGRREQLVVATKFGNRLDREWANRAQDGRPEYVRQAIEASLQRLGTDYVDLYYLHRLDPQVPVEETVGELGRLKAEGKIRAVGLSEVDAPTLRRAHATHPIAALQSEYSLWTREVEDEILPTAKELGIAFVAYSPLGRGVLAGSAPVEEGDRRNIHPRFKPDAVAANSIKRETLDRLAAGLGVTGAQLALAWVLSKGVVPIPGTRHVKHLEANWAAGEIAIDAALAAELEATFPVGGTAGERYPPGSPAVPGRTAATVA
jgi:aryl-alcohol dehydrogenase-like predicted oxidoreductase